MHVLLIEDNASAAKSLELKLTSGGHNVYVTASGEEGMELARIYDYDVILLDLDLPDVTGVEVVRELRLSKINAPVIVITATADVASKIQALSAGADDYVTKPFVAKELSARIRALLRRVRAGDGGTVLRFGDLEIQPDTGIVRRRGRDITLTKTEFRLLCELAGAGGKLLSREVLLQRVWGYDYFGDGRLVDVHIRRLRQKIEDDPGNPHHLVTSRGLGFKLQA
jgi:DNA-binding response OmpR family regulator